MTTKLHKSVSQSVSSTLLSSPAAAMKDGSSRGDTPAASILQLYSSPGQVPSMALHNLFLVFTAEINGVGNMRICVSGAVKCVNEARINICILFMPVQ